MKLLSFRAHRVLLVLAIIAGFSSTQVIAKGNPANNNVSFRIVQLSPDSPNFDFCDNGVIFATDIAFTDHTKYKYIPAAPESNAFTRSNAGDGCDNVLNTSVFTLPAGTVVSAIAMGSMNTVPPTAVIGPPATITLDNNTPAEQGSVKVRFFNFALASGTDTVDLVANGVTIADDAAALRNGGFVFMSQYITLPKGQTSFEVRDNDGNTLASAGRIQLGNRGVYTVFFHGDDNTGTDVLITEDSNNGKTVK